MPRLTQRVNVEIAGNGSQNGQRSWNVKIEAKDDLFFLSDQLAKQGVIKELPSSLRSAIRKTVADYITTGRKLIKGVTKTGIARK